MARPPIDPRLWRHARSARRYLALSVGLSVVITVSIVVTAIALARVLAGVITDPGRRSLGGWIVEIVVLVGAVALRVLATWVQARLAHRAGATVVAELETAVLTAGARLAPRELETRRTELAVIVSTGLTGLRAYLTGYLPALLLACLVPPIVLVVIAVHDPISGAIAVVTLPLIPVFMILIGLLTQGRAAATLAATTRLSDQLLDLFAGMPTLRALGREGGSGPAGSSPPHDAAPGSGHAAARPADTMEPRVHELGDSLRVRTMRALRIAFLSSMVLELLATLSVALIAVSIGLRLVFGEMSLYAGLVALILAPEVYLPLRMVGERFHAAQDGMAAADKAFAVLEPESDGGAGLFGPGTEVSNAEVGGSGAGTVDRSPAQAEGLIEIRDLAVPSRDGFAPAGLSAVFRPGLVTVLAGPNGSGKSTALQAILGLVTPDRGGVTVDGVDVRDLDPDGWWARVAWLPQRPVSMPGTLRENLELLGARTTDPSGRGAARVVDDLEAACVATGFDAVLDELPQRWETVVGAGGVGLSLGQRQRLALTRVLAADRAILLLDEPTAHLDHHSEATVLAALQQRARAGATVIAVGHRPTILAAADVVVQVRAATPDLAGAGPR
ncbi:ATP-binding cassette domain-containing protein [Nocardia sp. NPDC050710]|uniref:ABC transporter ATP-binding protein/permease n=1 Tax=Nocardia sp. NPDC050710 TaxID=3157220 RepID=UPI003410FE8D